MRDRKSVERSGVADPIPERWGRPYITYVEVCLGHICVAVVAYEEEMYSSPFCLVGEPAEPYRSRRNSYTGFCSFPCSGLSESVARGNRYIVPKHYSIKTR